MTRKVLFVAICALALVACKKNSEDTLDLAGMFVTGEAVDVTAFTATLIAHYHPIASVDVDKFGMFCSKDPDPDWDNNVWYVSMSEDNMKEEYRFKAAPLEPNTRYYYRTFIKTGALGIYNETLGEVRSFTTSGAEEVITTEQAFPATTQVLLRGSFYKALKGIHGKLWFRYGKVDPVTGYKSDPTTIEIHSGTILYDVFTYHITGLSPKTTVYYQAGATIGGKDYPGQEMTAELIDFAPSEGSLIDMGLSVKWGSCNVGAAKPEEFGDFFSWGETETKETYSEETYSYSGTPETLPADKDVASVKLGGAWRMPTRGEYEELINDSNTMREWDRYNEAYGLMFISKKTGGRIFFPAAGYIGSGGHKDYGMEGTYWASSNHCGMFFYKLDNLSIASECTGYYGRSVRGVQE